MGTTVSSHLCDPCASPSRSPWRWVVGGLALLLLAAFGFRNVVHDWESLYPVGAASPARSVNELAGQAAPSVLPLPVQAPAWGPKEELGRRLFHEPRLSADSSLSCASCHPLERGGADGRRVSVGVNGALGKFNAPTVFNAMFNAAQFWDGRVSTLDEQAGGPIVNPAEMAAQWPDVLQRLAADASYRQAFLAAFGTATPQQSQVTQALAAFERTLITPNSRFDQYLMGERQALNEQELRGYQRFQDLGCVSCHQGRGLGGNLFQPFGVMLTPQALARYGGDNPGRYAVTGLERDRGVFKVPGLRNVALTAPYFHDGSVATLEEAVWVMGQAQLGRDLPRQAVDDLVAFLRTLTGQWQGKPLQ
ncbi:cytochrome-c peroxidase [Hydrogenophaga soli]